MSLGSAGKKRVHELKRELEIALHRGIRESPKLLKFAYRKTAVEAHADHGGLARVLGFKGNEDVVEVDQLFAAKSHRRLVNGGGKGDALEAVRARSAGSVGEYTTHRLGCDPEELKAATLSNCERVGGVLAQAKIQIVHQIAGGKHGRALPAA